MKACTPLWQCLPFAMGKSPCSLVWATLCAFFPPLHVGILFSFIFCPYSVSLSFPKTGPKMTHTNSFQPCPHVLVEELSKPQVSTLWLGQYIWVSRNGSIRSGLSGALFYETGSHAAMADPKLTLWPRTALNTSFLCLYLPSRITGVGHHMQQYFVSESSLSECQKRKSILFKPTFPEQLDIHILKWHWIPFSCHIENVIKLWANDINCLDANIEMGLNDPVMEHCPW